MRIHGSIVVAFAAAAILGAIVIYFSRMKPGVLRRILIISLATIFVAAGVFDVCFYLMAEKVYTYENIISIKSTPLKMVSGNYYLTLNNGQYKYLCADSIQAKTIDARNCEKTFDKESIPRIVEKEVARTYHKEWLWFYGNPMGEDVVVYEFVIPSRDSILDTNNSERASAEP